MKFIIGISMMVCLLMVAWCSKEKPVAPAYFDCEYYNYFPNDTFPVITTQDSLAVAELLVSKGMYSAEKIKSLGVEGVDHFTIHFLGYIKGTMDTFLFNKFLTNTKRQEKIIYKKLNWYHLANLIMADAVVEAKVVDKKLLSDTTRCLFYKTLYVLQVREVVVAKFPIKKGDYILTGTTSGYQGGCIRENPKVFSQDSHSIPLNIGEYRLYGLKHAGYAQFFLNKFLKSKYADDYCPNMFGVQTYDDWSIKDSKQFCQEFMANK